MSHYQRTSTVSMVRVDPEHRRDEGIGQPWSEKLINDHISARAQEPGVVEVRVAGVISLSHTGAWVLIETIRETLVA